MFKFKNVVAAAVATMVSSAAMALPGASTAFTSGVNNKISDDFGEFLFVDGGVVGRVDVGDVFFTWLEINTFAPSGLAKTAVNELTLVAAIEVASVLAVPPAFVTAVCGPSAVSCAAFTFKAPGLATWAAIYGSLGLIAPVTNPLTAATVGVIYEDASNAGAGDFSLLTPASAANGLDRMVVDMLVGDLWQATGPEFLADFAAPPDGSQLGSFTLDLTISSQSFAGWNLGPDFKGSGVLFPDSNVASKVGGDASFFFDANQVPEPGSLALIGVALAGLGLTSRRRKA